MRYAFQFLFNSIEYQVVEKVIRGVFTRGSIADSLEFVVDPNFDLL